MGDGRTNTENRKENILTQSRADQSANIFDKDKNMTMTLFSWTANKRLL